MFFLIVDVHIQIEKMIAEMTYAPTSVEEMNRDCFEELKMLFDKSERYTACTYLLTYSLSAHSFFLRR